MTILPYQITLFVALALFAVAMFVIGALKNSTACTILSVPGWLFTGIFAMQLRTGADIFNVLGSFCFFMVLVALAWSVIALWSDWKEGHPARTKKETPSERHRREREGWSKQAEANRDKVHDRKLDRLT